MKIKKKSIQNTGPGVGPIFATSSAVVVVDTLLTQLDPFLNTLPTKHGVMCRVSLYRLKVEFVIVGTNSTTLVTLLRHYHLHISHLLVIGVSWGLGELTSLTTVAVTSSRCSCSPSSHLAHIPSLPTKELCTEHLRLILLLPRPLPRGIVQFKAIQIFKNAVVLDITRERNVIRCFLMVHDLFLFRTSNHQPRFSSISDDTSTEFCLKILITDRALRLSVMKSKHN